MCTLNKKKKTFILIKKNKKFLIKNYFFLKSKQSNTRPPLLDFKYLSVNPESTKILVGREL